MAKVFGILSAVVLAVAAYVASKNQAAYESTIANTQAEHGKLSKGQAKLKATQQTLAALPIEIAGVEEEVTKLKADEAAQTKTNAALAAQVEPMTAKVASDKAKLDAFREKTSVMGNVQELASKLRATSAELEELSQSISTAEAKLADMTAQNVSAEKQVTTAKVKLDSYTSGKSLPSLRTSIRSIYSNWGFVTLAAGNNSGVVGNSTLAVTRDGEIIAKLLVTAVETNSASATVIPDSIASDVTLMVGDSVVPSSDAVTAALN
jgi:predicted RNase H-like nuclease (RuvC/YqgF family)